MKKLFLVTSVTTAISLVSIANADTNGTVTFSGKLSDQTCQVTLNDGTSASGTVVLPGVPKSQLSANGNVAGATPFRLKLIGCKASDTAFGVTAYFPKNSANIYGTNLINKETGPDAASGVSLQLIQNINGSRWVVPLGWRIDQYHYQTIDANSTSGTLEYTIQYINSGGTGSVQAGKVTGIAIYELAYN